MRRKGNSLAARAAARHELAVRKARRDFAAFCELCFSWRLAPFQQAWIDAIETHPRVAILAPIEHAKSSLCSVAYPLWRLGREPNLRIGLISETATQAQRPLAAIREAIQQNTALREVFPSLRPARGARERWTTNEIVVERQVASKDPSAVALGVLGPLLGSRLDLALLDDVCSWENTFTSAQREKVIGWFKSTLVGRVVDSGKVVAIGTPWHPEDLLGSLACSGEYTCIRNPAIGDEGRPLWPEQWPDERLAQRRREIGEVEFSRQMLLEVISDETSRFKAIWFEDAFRTSTGLRLMENYDGPCQTFTGVDLGVGQTAKHDQTAIVTIALHEDGTRQLINLECGRWQAPELIERLSAVRERYGGRLRVESNAAQAYITQWLTARGIPVEAHTTTARSKFDPVYGVESLAVEIERGRWLLPDASETRALAREMLAYSPGSHCGDRLMAAWLAREAARQFEDRRPLGIPFITSSSGDALMPDVTGQTTVVARPGDLPDDTWGAPVMMPFLRG